MKARPPVVAAIVGFLLLLCGIPYGCGSEDRAQTLPPADAPPHGGGLYLGPEADLWTIIGAAAEIARMLFGT